MIYISHRGNINGRIQEAENKPEYIDDTLTMGYDVEIDVWYVDNGWWLGHDEPQYQIDLEWLDKRSEKLWVHCKNIQAVEFFYENENECKDINWFWHEEDTLTLTSYGYIWAYPGKQPIKKSIAVMPEIYNDDISYCSGICSDVIQKYKDENK
ncbi:MAG: hypothetical protein EBS55_14060 [Flavobacteriaceae bacterium]|nr:hypothetical protein [Flavobacteriaceae bacterium]